MRARAATFGHPLSRKGVLFLWTGSYDIMRILRARSNWEHWQSRRHDGHDVLWTKLSLALFAVPMVFGFRTNISARLMALALLAEAFFAWGFFFTDHSG